VRRLVAALPFQYSIFVNQRGKTASHSFQFQVKSLVQTNIVSTAKIPEKESGDESPHSKGRLFRGRRAEPRCLWPAIDNFSAWIAGEARTGLSTRMVLKQ
jgi:hypothetical protein